MRASLAPQLKRGVIRLADSRESSHHMITYTKSRSHPGTAMRVTFGVLVAALICAACSSSPPPDANGPRPSKAPEVDRSTLTQTQFGAHQFNTAYDAVEALRSNWLKTRG